MDQTRRHRREGVRAEQHSSPASIVSFSLCLRCLTDRIFPLHSFDPGFGGLVSPKTGIFFDPTVFHHFCKSAMANYLWDRLAAAEGIERETFPSRRQVWGMRRHSSWPLLAAGPRCFGSFSVIVQPAFMATTKAGFSSGRALT
ncbi:hypothetical protein ACVWXP_007493 [Bradyrhizobium sp. USDA 4463]